MPSKVISIPAASRTFNALRDLGYDLNSAVADIIDNSISRGKARNIYVYFNKNLNNKFFIRICDDGIGMSSSILEEAMRLGSSNNDYEAGDLSKYGMGLKTASLSQAHKLNVISAKKGFNKTGYSWDMFHVKKTDKWELFKHSSEEINLIKNNLVKEQARVKNNSIEKLFTKDSWTIVLWNEMKDFQKNYDSYTSSVTAENYFHRETDKLLIYLRMVFSRFIDGENDARKTNIFFNDVKLDSFDPFCRKEKHTIEMPVSEKNGNYVIDKDLPPIIIKRYLLPTNPTKPGNFQFSSYREWEEAKGNLSWNEAQGYYVYRNNRLINWGGWYRTKTIDEHDKLARASIDLTDAHDELFTLDVKKTRIQFPEDLKNHLQDNINKGFIAAAKKRYSASEKKVNQVENPVREKSKKISHLSRELVDADKITVTEDQYDFITIKNIYGSKITDDLTYRTLEAGQKIISGSFGNDKFFWKMIPNPDSDFQVLVNTDHPFYETVYGNAKEDKKITAIMDAFLFTMSFIELKCITSNNELLFEQMKEVASSVLKKFVEASLLNFNIILGNICSPTFISFSRFSIPSSLDFSSIHFNQSKAGLFAAINSFAFSQILFERVES